MTSRTLSGLILMVSIRGAYCEISPRGCEITGFHVTPDNRTAFVNIQHPGETPGDRSNPDNPRAQSNWPDYDPDGRPRSATVVIRRKDGGIIGT